MRTTAEKSAGSSTISVAPAPAPARESLLRGSDPSPILDPRAVRTVLTDLDYLVIPGL
jgi:hypothetical protein